MQIKNIRIQDFKSIVDKKLDKLSDVNMIFGHNNSGKSNVLKFLQLIFSSKIPNLSSTTVDQSRGISFDVPNESPKNFWEGIIENQPYIFRNNDYQTPIKFEVELEIEKNMLTTIGASYEAIMREFFDNANKSVSLEIKGSINSIGEYDSSISLSEVSLERIRIFQKGETDIYFETLQTDEYGLKTNGYQVLSEILGTMNNSILFLDNDRFFTREIEDKNQIELTSRTFKNWFHNLSLGANTYKSFVKIINDIKSFQPRGESEFNNIEKNSPINKSLNFEFSRLQGNLEIMMTNDIGKRFPLENFGTGIQQILFILANIAEKQPKILLIEEIELNLSPMYQDQFIQHILLNLIKNPDNNLSQIFFTTHSPVLCMRPDFQIHQVTIGETGVTDIERLGEKKSKIKEFYTEQSKAFFMEQELKS